MVTTSSSLAIAAPSTMSSKISLNTLYQAVWEVLPENQCKWRNFLETVELQISLKNCDPQKDKHFPGTIRLKSAPCQKFCVCVLGDPQPCDEAKAKDILNLDSKALKKPTRIRNWGKKDDAFLASESLIQQIPRILGPGLNKAGRSLPC